jgi:hypothetical protein
MIGDEPVRDPDAVVSVRELGPDDRPEFVYDLETANHHFAVGPGNLVVHNTDSIFMTFPDAPPADTDEERMRAAIAKGKEVTAAISAAVNRPHKMAYEKTFFPFVIFCPKKYAGMKYEEDPKEAKFAHMGIVLKRRDNPPIVKDIYGTVLLEYFMKNRTVAEAAAWLRGQLAELLAGRVPFKKLVITKSLAGSYKFEDRVDIARLAKRMGARDPASRPTAGSRLQFVYVQTKDEIEHAPYARSHDVPIDFPAYVERQIESPVQQLLALAVESIPGHDAVYGPQHWADRYAQLLDAGLPADKADKKLQECKEAAVHALLFADLLTEPARRRDLAVAGQRDLHAYFGGIPAPATADIPTKGKRAALPAQFKQMQLNLGPR